MTKIQQSQNQGMAVVHDVIKPSVSTIQSQSPGLILPLPSHTHPSLAGGQPPTALLDNTKKQITLKNLFLDQGDTISH